MDALSLILEDPILTLNSIDYQAFTNSDLGRILAECRNVGKRAFSNCAYLTEVNISGVESVGLRAFSNIGCTTTKRVILKDKDSNYFYPFLFLV